MLRAVTACGVCCGLLLTAAAAEEPRVNRKSEPTFTVSRETTRIIEPLTADGWPDYIAALNRRYAAGVTPENNAAVLFYRAFGPAPDRCEQPDRFFELLGIPKPPPDGEYFVDFGPFLLAAGVDERELRGIRDQQLRAMLRPWTADQLPQLTDWLIANQNPLSLIIEGTRRPKYFSPMVGSDEPPRAVAHVTLPGVQQSREVARALCARAMLQAAAGQIEPAWEDILACHRLGRLVARGPTLIESLVGIALESMAVATGLAFIEHTKPDAATVQRYLADLEQLPAFPAMAEKIDLCERYIHLDCVRVIAGGGEDALTLIGRGGETLLGWLSRNPIDWDVVLRVGNERFDRMTAALEKADHRERDAAVAAVSEAFEELHQAGDIEALDRRVREAENPREAASRLGAVAMMRWLSPVTSPIVVAADRAEQRIRNLRVALALAAYHSDHGRYPPKLDDLAPRYLKAVPDDVFSSKPLVYQPGDAGYVLYSVGQNRIDDGGRDHSDDPPGGDDIAVRVPSRAGE